MLLMSWFVDDFKIARIILNYSERIRRLLSTLVLFQRVNELLGN